MTTIETSKQEGTIPEAPTNTVIPSEELAKQLPFYIDAWVPTAYRALSDDEHELLNAFLHRLPVSVELDSFGLRFLSRLVTPLFEGRTCTVTPQQIAERWVKEYSQGVRKVSLSKIESYIGELFKTSKRMVIGQLEVECEISTNTLTLRMNPANSGSVLEFLRNLPVG